MSRTPSDCIDHDAPFLIYVTTEGKDAPIMLTIVEKEGGERHRFPLTEARAQILASDMILKAVQKAT